jgi:hypothetical protein
MSVQFDKLGDVKPKVTAGGKDKTKFVPNLNVSFFDDEFYFNLNRKDKIIKNEKAATVNGKTSLGGIDTDIWYIDDKGRFKWDIEFTSRPAANSWTWELKHTKGIEFYHQPALTAEEIAGGCERPEEVVGSYAVYCNKAHNKYKTGKLCHIYRPFCYDAKGNTIYADLKIADGQLTITIDTKWLDSATYPVRLDPTFGYTSVGSSTDIWAHVQASKPYSTPESNGTLTSIYLHARTATGLYFKAAIYSESSGSPNSLLASNSTGVALSSSSAWVSCPVSYTGIIAGVNYWLAHNGGDVRFSFDTATGENKMENEDNFPETFGTYVTYNQRKSFYAEYTASAVSEGPLVGASALVGGGVLCGQGNLIN